jgi:hypothetical protein
MKIKTLWLLLFLILTFLSTTGEQCSTDINSLLFGDNADVLAIKGVISQLKDGINSQNKSLLEGIISKQFETGGMSQLGQIQNYFDQKLTINDIKIGNINIDGKGATGSVDWTGTLTLKPKPNIPFIADKIPTLSGDVSAGFIFGFVKEKDDKWRIKAQKVLKMVKSAVWGKDYPVVSSYDLNKSEVVPGDSIKVDAELKRVGGNVMLAAVNTKPLINSIFGLSDGPIDTVKLNVPKDKKPGSTYDVYLIALGVNANFADPAKSSIAGITFKQMSVPVVE